MNTPSSYSLSEYTKTQIERLAAAHRLTKSTVVALAVDRFFAQTMSANPPGPFHVLPSSVQTAVVTIRDASG